MKQIGILFFILLATTALKAQSNYKSAKLITTQGDTLKGFVNYKGNDKTPSAIEFKQSLEASKSTAYKANDLQSFEVIGITRYISYRGKLSTDRNVFPNLGDVLDTAARMDTVFLEQVYSGSPLSLYRHQDELKPRYFVQEDAGQPVELLFHQYYTQGSNYRTVRVFANQLTRLAFKLRPQDATVQQRIANASFRESDIIAILKSVNNDDKQVASVAGVRFFAGLAINRTVTKFSESSVFYKHPYTGYMPRISAGADVLLNKYTQRFFFRGELAFSMIQPKFEASGTGDTKSYQQEFSQYTVSLLPQAIFNVYNADMLKVFVGAGASVNYSVYGNNKVSQTSAYDVTFTKEFTDFQSSWISFPVEAGVTLKKKLSMYVQYTAPTGYNNNASNSYTLSNTVYSLGVHYFIN